ncbi:hypothetical protein B0H10DRAFT_2202683 [Mycena sp. CBHHK59/15]|nr:hypothetical protein B0H10DRAFT_2202683 [Mycena sp. CBHHK59/15]
MTSGTIGMIEAHLKTHTRSGPNARTPVCHYASQVYHQALSDKWSDSASPEIEIPRGTPWTVDGSSRRTRTGARKARIMPKKRWKTDTRTIKAALKSKVLYSRLVMAPRELSKRSHSASCWAPHLSIASETLRIPNAPISITKATHTTFSPPFSFHSGAQPITAAKKSVLEKKDVAAAIREYEEDSETETEGEQGYWTTQLWNSVETLRFLPHRFLNPIELRRLAPAPLHTDAIKENSPETAARTIQLLW